MRTESFCFLVSLPPNIRPEELTNTVAIEWVKAEDFHAFIKSDQFANFAGSIKHLVTGPPTLQLFETNFSPREAASASVVEIVRLSVSSPEKVLASTQAWDQLAQILKAKYTPITYGTSTNLENSVVVGIIGWSGEEVCQKLLSYAVQHLFTINRLGPR